METKVNLHKISKMEELAFENAIRLHKDSAVLFKNKSYPSAFFLSVLAMEEFGKAIIFSDMVFNSLISGPRTSIRNFPVDFFGIKSIEGIYQHRLKQSRFASIASEFSTGIPMLPQKLWEGVESGKIEYLKQMALYVGLPRKNGAINLKGKISTPKIFSRQNAMRQITAVNDYLIDLISGIIEGSYSYDNENIEKKILNRRLLRVLEK